MDNSTKAQQNKPVPLFVEDKHIDFSEVQRLLQISIRANHHSNFGPVSKKLELVLGEINLLSDNYSACCASSATTAISAGISCLENHFGRKLKWLVSEFGFMTNFIGPFINQKIVPCCMDGMIDIEHIKTLDIESFDGILATNVFGLHENFDELFHFCLEHKKVLMIDNAAGFRALSKYHREFNDPEKLLWIEVISLHHTKPWGMGEGGAIFLPLFLLDTFRSAINFGVLNGEYLDKLTGCTNGKMSEISAALILSRVQNHLNWSASYREQAARILGLGIKAGLIPMIEKLPIHAVPGQIAFQSPKPITWDMLQSIDFPILKYYRPGPNANGLANHIYENVVNIPCHADMTTVSDDDFTSILESLT